MLHILECERLKDMEGPAALLNIAVALPNIVVAVLRHCQCILYLHSGKRLNTYFGGLQDTVSTDLHYHGV